MIHSAAGGPEAMPHQGILLLAVANLVGAAVLLVMAFAH